MSEHVIRLIYRGLWKRAAKVHAMETGLTLQEAELVVREAGMELLFV